MKRICITIAMVVLLTQAFLPATASAQSQSTPPRSGGELMLRNALIGAAVGAGVIGGLAVAAGGDCGNCAGDNTKAILSGAMYGAFIGAALRLHPSRRPTPGQPSRKPTPTFNPHISRHVKAVNVVVRF